MVILYFLEFFIKQINDKIASLNIPDKQALAFIKSKLVEKALKFYVSSIPCYKASTSSELFNIFRK